MSVKIKKFFDHRFYKRHFSQIYTIAEKNVKLQMRFKFQLVFSIIRPLLTIFLSLIILSRFFAIGARFEPWDDTNYLIFLFTAYNIELLRRVIDEFSRNFIYEKYWKTLPALMIAPFNKVHLLFGILVSHLIIISIPFMLFFILAYLIYPISIFTIFFVIIIFLLIDLIFSGIGLFLGAFCLSKEGAMQILYTGIGIIFWFSCITYPFELFPGIIQGIIQLNPLYYVFDVIRMTWLDDNILLTVSNFPYHFVILIGTAIVIPSIAIYVFRLVYNKFGIAGY
ncbi:MAG: ABC transporter permease [Promethearchaeota archaeon]